MAYQELDGSSNPITIEKFIQSTNQAGKLYAESNTYLTTNLPIPFLQPSIPP
jgi:hypothetical protein